MLILNKKGQGALEFILLFTFSLFITGGLVYQFNDAFRQYVNSYFGEYLTCLIEAGELPSLGYDGANGANECQDEFQPFDLAKGRPPRGTNAIALSPLPAGPGPSAPVPAFVPKPVNFGSKGTFPTDTGSDSKGSDGGGGGSLAGNRNVPLAGGGSGNENGIGGGRWGGGLNGDKKEGRPTTVGLNKEEKEASESSIESTGGGVIGRFARSKKSDDRPGIVPLSYEEKDAEERNHKETRVPATEKDAVRGNLVDATDGKKRAKALDADAEVSLDFGDWLRYIIIAAIVIVLALIIGGQALQISKSQEK